MCFFSSEPWELYRIRPVIHLFTDSFSTRLFPEKNKQWLIHLKDKKRLVLIVHGFRDGLEARWMHRLKDTLLRCFPQSVAVALVGWRAGADLPLWQYCQAAKNIVSVGEWLATFLAKIKENLTINLYGIGHSLGAHLLGVAGRSSPGCLDRITGLDPAGPCFERKNSEMLRSTDAARVDVIHTDGYDSRILDPSHFPLNHFGTLHPMGHLDFYPNWGYHQPGTSNGIAKSHGRAIKLFEWSVENSDAFITQEVLVREPRCRHPVKVAKPSKHRAEMGYWSDCWPLPPLNSSSLFYIKTRSQSPWVDKRDTT